MSIRRRLLMTSKPKVKAASLEPQQAPLEPIKLLKEEEKKPLEK